MSFFTGEAVRVVHGRHRGAEGRISSQPRGRTADVRVRKDGRDRIIVVPVDSLESLPPAETGKRWSLYRPLVGLYGKGSPKMHAMAITGGGQIWVAEPRTPKPTSYPPGPAWSRLGDVDSITPHEDEG